MKKVNKIQKRYLRLMTNNYELSYEELLDLIRLTKYNVVIIQKKVHKFIFTANPFIILKHISDVSSELHSLSSFHLYNIIHKNSYFCQGGYRDKLQ